MREKGSVYSSGADEVESGVKHFKPGDTIAITLPRGGYAVAVIGRLTMERMLCTTFGPRIDNIFDAAKVQEWAPQGWSTWIADTLGLRDGSWFKIEEPPAMAGARHIDTQRLPRFKYTTKSGEQKLAEYDPNTLFVGTLIESPDPEEFRRAPSFLPQDATTFEIAVSKNMDSPCDLPDAETRKVLNEERLVVALLREQMTGTTDTLLFDHVFAFKKKSEAERVHRELTASGYAVSEPIKASWFARTALEVHIRAVASYPVVREDIKRMRELALRYGAVYDGFGAAAL